MMNATPFLAYSSISTALAYDPELSKATTFKAQILQEKKAPLRKFTCLQNTEPESVPSNPKHIRCEGHGGGAYHETE